MTTNPHATCFAGTFRGMIDADANVWKGIRYAEAPVGELRWRAPVAKPPASNVMLCHNFTPISPQLVNPMVKLPSGFETSDDSLSLNIWAPQNAAGLLPVMVWIHGGAYMFGSSTQLDYNGTRLATESNVVVVTLNYRVGAFGFLDLTRCGEPGEFDTNLALRDVMLALEWVQKNIAAFGGDPEHVTIFGESAGGGIVTTLLACPSAEGLFHRAIAQSSPASSVYGQDRAFQIAKRLLTRLGISAGDGKELRNISVSEILEAATSIYESIPQEMPGTLAFAPVIDGELIPESPVEALHAGRGLPVPLIIGTNRNEASAFRYMKSPILPITRDRIERMLFDVQAERPGVEVPPLERIHASYEGIRLQTLGLGIARDIGFRLPALWIAEGHSRVAPTWLYRFDQATPLLTVTGLGAAHATEVPYVWRSIGESWNDLVFWFGGRRTAYEVSARMSERWVSFANGKEPLADAPECAWPQYDTESRLSLVIDRVPRIVEDLDANIREGWGEGILAFG